MSLRNEVWAVLQRSYRVRCGAQTVLEKIEKDKPVKTIKIEQVEKVLDELNLEGKITKWTFGTDPFKRIVYQRKAERRKGSKTISVAARIAELLEERPLTEYEIGTKINAKFERIRFHLAELSNTGIVQRMPGANDMWVLSKNVNVKPFYILRRPTGDVHLTKEECREIFNFYFPR